MSSVVTLWTAWYTNRLHRTGQSGTYVVVVFRKQVLVGGHGEDACVDKAFPCHEIKNPLHLLNAPDADETPDDDVRNASLRGKGFLCLEMRPENLPQRTQNE